MIIITVARKPLEGTVARNALKHGTGGINIDAVRTGGPSPSVDRRMHAAPGVSVGSTGWTTPARPESYNTQKPGEMLGRWPANLVLSHLAGCLNQGTANIPAGPPTPSGMDRINANMQLQGARPNAYQQGVPPPPPDRRNPDGTETVAVWVCEDGCPVAALDDQSGERPGMSGGGATLENSNKKTGREVVPAFNRKPSAPFIRSDTGGASRFFKQVQNEV